LQREKACGDSTNETSLEDREARYRKARILLKNAIAIVKERKVRALQELKLIIKINIKNR